MEKLDFPNRVTVELTNRCNLSCTFCPRQSIDMNLGDMEMTLYKKIIDEMALHRPIKLLLFFRGESLLHPNLIDMARYAKNKEIDNIFFSSNGLLLDDKIADELLDVGIDDISFSIDTLDESVYNSFRVAGDLKKTIENVVSFTEKCKKRRLSELSSPKVQVSTIDTDSYSLGQDEFIKFWMHHADSVRVYYEHDEKAGIVSKKGTRDLQHLKERKPCRKVFTDFLIFCNGDVTLCNYAWQPIKELGNVNDRSIKEIWDSKEFNDIRDMHYNNNFKSGIICENCEHWKIDYTEKGYLGESYNG